MEILAPAGAMEQLIAAVRCGANAVYLGTKNFNARRSAGNFDDDELVQAVKYCHERGVKVHVTFNTLLTDAELSGAARQIEVIARSGADAAIVQDLAVARLFGRICPDMALHASTQLSIHNASGAQLMRELGFSRVVLARELSLDEIAAIRKSTDIELETFVHGALCMSVSGQCYLSAMLGGRSGNRGMCAQPCRLDFTAPTGRHFALSLKDMSYVRRIGELERAGVCSIKIEGRMKRPEYVASAVTACRVAINGDTPDVEALRAVFSRGGFTDGYLSARTGEDMFGVRTKDDAATGDVLTKAQALYRQETPLVGVDMLLRAANGRAASLRVCDGEHTVNESGDIPLPATGRPMDEPYARRALEKTGGTPYFLQSLSTDIAPGLFMPMKALNALRARALGALSRARAECAPRQIFPAPEIPARVPARSGLAPEVRLRFLDAAQVDGGFDYSPYAAILPLDSILVAPALLTRFKAVYAEIDELVFPSDEAALCDKLIRAKALGCVGAYVNNAGALLAARGAGLDIHGGYGLNVLNTMAVTEYEALGAKSLTVSFEGLLSAARELGGGIKRGIIAYGRLPVMLCRACPNKKGRVCAPGCDGRPLLRDRMGMDFPYICRNKRYGVLLNPVPLNLCDKAVDGLDFMTLYFTTEGAADCCDIIRDFREGDAPRGQFTRGLYYKKLQ